MAENNEDRAHGLREKLYGLVGEERQLRREIGARVLAGEGVVDLVALRAANRETQENLAAAIVVVQARTAA